MSVIAQKILDFFIDKVWGYIMAWVKLPWTIKKIQESAKPAQISPNARLCPNCDNRMMLSSIYGEGNWFKCHACNISQWYKTKH